MKSITEKLDEMLRVARAATQVVNWYPHGPYDGYHPGAASVRGPFWRWLIVNEGRGWDQSKPKPVANVEDDAKFAAMAMNNLVPLVESLREAVVALEFYSRNGSQDRESATTWHGHTLHTLDKFRSLDEEIMPYVFSEEALAAIASRMKKLGAG